MQKNTLMIGDWVDCLTSTHKERCFARIGAIEEYHTVLVEKDNANWFLDEENINPIPLTPKILEKNGFVYDDLPMCQTWDGYGLHIYGTTGNYNINCGDNVSLNVSNVHQLQQVLRLCEIDKEIEL